MLNSWFLCPRANFHNNLPHSLWFKLCCAFAKSINSLLLFTPIQIALLSLHCIIFKIFTFSTHVLLLLLYRTLFLFVVSQKFVRKLHLHTALMLVLALEVLYQEFWDLVLDCQLGADLSLPLIVMILIF